MTWAGGVVAYGGAGTWRGSSMGLPASQQRVLDRIEEALKRREPRLVSMFAIFTRLNLGERLPARAVLFFSLAIALILSAVFIGMSQSTDNCRPPLTPHASLIGLSRAG